MVKEKIGKLERKVEFIAGYDKRHTDPKKDYGVHGVDIVFSVKGKHGAISLIICTNWYPTHCRDYPLVKNGMIFFPMAADIGYHSYTPQRDWQTKPSQEKCRFLDNKPCYYDGSALRANDFFDILTDKGEDALWKELEKEYEIQLGKE